MAGAAKHRVFENMCDSGRIIRRRAETDCEKIVRVLVLKVDPAGAGRAVLQLDQADVQFFDVEAVSDFEVEQGVAGMQTVIGQIESLRLLPVISL